MHTDSFQPPQPKEYQNPLILPWLVILLIVRGWVSMIHPLVRSNFGSRYFRLHEFFGFVVLWMFVGHSVHPSNYGIYIAYTVAVLIMMIYHSARANRADKLMDQHPKYNGKPLVMRFLPVSEDIAKGIIEPLLIVSTGFVLFHSAQQQFGVFLMIGGVLSCLEFARIHDKDLYRMNRMYESEMEMRYQQQQYENFKRGRN